MMMEIQESTENEPSDRPRLNEMFVQELYKIKGEAWMTFKGLRVEFPLEIWKDYA